MLEILKELDPEKFIKAVDAKIKSGELQFIYKEKKYYDILSPYLSDHESLMGIIKKKDSDLVVSVIRSYSIYYIEEEGKSRLQTSSSNYDFMFFKINEKTQTRLSDDFCGITNYDRTHRTVENLEKFHELADIIDSWTEDYTDTWNTEIEDWIGDL